jgi:hypothetical protein|tara:strand:- start:5672 stop:6142 length:471 start_codon:yes stop_codon:yes gene_type:complete
LALPRPSIFSLIKPSLVAKAEITSRQNSSLFFIVGPHARCVAAMANEIEVVELLDSSEDEAAPMDEDDVEVRVVDAAREIRAPVGAAGGAADDDEIEITGKQLLAPLLTTSHVRATAPVSPLSSSRIVVSTCRYDTAISFPIRLRDGSFQEEGGQI